MGSSHNGELKDTKSQAVQKASDARRKKRSRSKRTVGTREFERFETTQQGMLLGRPGKRVAIYPGTFDPLTNGHVSLLRRGFDVFDGLLVAVAADTGKKTLFSLEERVSMVQEVFAKEPRVTVEPFSGLLMDFVREKKCKAILRGLRAVSDFEYEFQMGLMNRRLHHGVQTIYMMTDYKWLYISSTIIKNVAELGGNIHGLVPDSVEEHLRRRYAELREQQS